MTQKLLIEAVTAYVATKQHEHEQDLLTDATRASVRELTEAGKTGKEIAATVGISLPSVQNIKKALGLVRKKNK